MFPNKIIQNYKVSHLLGSGGMGEVWAGAHLYMDRKVAIKALHQSLVSNPEIRGRFKNEAVTMSQLEHPNIVRLYDYIEQNDGVYLVMEYVDGDPLDQYILRKTGPIPEGQARQLFEQMLLGLQYAHQHGVIHRDIKPSNFMVTPQKQVLILDFGIAKLLESVGPQRTKAGTRIGTVLYMSPEQVQGHETDARSDIYALGVTLFQMLTGQCPYPNDASEYDVYQRIVNEPLPRAASFYPAVSAEMQALIDKATAKKPQDRFQNCADFLAALLGKSTITPVTAKATIDQASEKKAANAAKSKKKRMHWALKTMIWLVVLGGIGAAGYVWGWPLLQKEIETTQQRTPATVALEFLDYIEKGEGQTAGYLTAGNCGLEIQQRILASQMREKQSYEILDAETIGVEAVVTYRGLKDHRRAQLKLFRRRGMWEVDCW